MWQADSLHPLSVHFFEGMMVRSTLFNDDVEPSHRAKYKTMEKGVPFNMMQHIHSFAMNSGLWHKESRLPHVNSFLLKNILSTLTMAIL